MNDMILLNFSIKSLFYTIKYKIASSDHVIYMTRSITGD